MKKIFSFVCLFMAIVAMSSCSSAKEEKGTSGTGNAALDNIFERKSVRTYLNKGVEKENSLSPLPYSDKCVRFYAQRYYPMQHFRFRTFLFLLLQKNMSSLQLLP